MYAPIALICLQCQPQSCIKPIPRHSQNLIAIYAAVCTATVRRDSELNMHMQGTRHVTMLCRVRTAGSLAVLHHAGMHGTHASVLSDQHLCLKPRTSHAGSASAGATPCAASSCAAGRCATAITAAVDNAHAASPLPFQL